MLLPAILSLLLAQSPVAEPPPAEPSSSPTEEAATPEQEATEPVALPPEPLARPVQLTPVESPKSVYWVSWWIDSAVTVAATIGGAVPYFIQDSIIKPRCPCDPHEVLRIDRGLIGQNAKWADDLALILSIAGLVPPFVISAIDVGVTNKVFWEDFLVLGESLTLSYAACSASKFISQRPIPRVYVPGQDPVAEVTPGGYRAFYSGHVAMAVTVLTAGAMTWTFRHGFTWWPWILDGAVGLALSAGVLVSGGHWYTDVIFGWGAAILFGTVVPLIHHRWDDKVQISVAPTQGGGAVVFSGKL